MTFARIRQVMAAAGLIALGAAAQGQSLGGSPGLIGAPQPGSPQIGAPGLSPAPSSTLERPAQPVDLGALGSFPEPLMNELVLTPAQRAKLDEAQTARKKMWADNQVSRKAEYDELAKELDRGVDFDPHAVIAMRKAARTEMQTRMDAVQDLWLEFWDTLDKKQRGKMVDYMIAQHERHGKIRRSGP